MEAPVVQVFFNGRAVQSVPFEGEVLTIGRRKDNDIVLNNLSVSRHHATLRKLERTIVLEDGGSENGCYVNGKRVRLAVLKSGDVIRIAKHQIVVRAAGDADVVADAEAPALKVLPAQRDLLDGAHTREIGADTRAMLLDVARADHLASPPQAAASPVVAAPAPAPAPAPVATAPDAGGSIFDLKDADFVVETEEHVPEAPTPPPQPAALDAGAATEVGMAPAAFPDGAETSAPALPLYAGLVVQSGGKLERVVSWDQPVLRVGRAVDCDVVLPQTKVSRNHAQFSRDGERFEVQDLGSVNFTFVNGEKIARHELHVGDVVQIGDFEFTFVLENQPIGRELRQATTEGRIAEAPTAPPATVVAALASPPQPAALPEAEVDVPDVLFGGDEEKDLEALDAQAADFPVPRDVSPVPPRALRAQLAAAVEAGSTPGPTSAPDLRAAAAPPAGPVSPAALRQPAEPAPLPIPAAPQLAEPQLPVAPPAVEPEIGIAAVGEVGFEEPLEAALPSTDLSPEPGFDLTPEIGADLEEVAELAPLSAEGEGQAIDAAAVEAAFDLSAPDFAHGAEEVEAPTLLAGAADLDAVLAEPPALDLGGLDVEIEADTGPGDSEPPALDVDEDTFSDGRPTEILLSDSLDAGETQGAQTVQVDAGAPASLFDDAGSSGSDLAASAAADGGLVALSDVGSALSVALSEDESLGDESVVGADAGSTDPAVLVIETPAEALFEEAQAAPGGGETSGGAPVALELEIDPQAVAASPSPAEEPAVGPCAVATASDSVLPGVPPLAAVPDFFEAVPAPISAAPGSVVAVLGLAEPAAAGTPGGPGPVPEQPAPVASSPAAPVGFAVATALPAAADTVAGSPADTVRFELRLRIDQFPEPLRSLLLGTDGQGLRIPFEIRLRTGKD
jgi:pSer/pThr/pTyr-binding forkhead associated (FHA) protein